MDLREVGCGGHGLDRTGAELRQVAGTCECGTEPSGFIKCGGIFLLVEEGSVSQEGVSK